MSDQLDKDIAVIKEKLDSLERGMQEFKAALSEQYSKLEGKVQIVTEGETDHQRRISVLEADKTSEMLLAQMIELKETWTCNQQNMWRLVFILVLILAGIIGITKLPSIPF